MAIYRPPIRDRWIPLIVTSPDFTHEIRSWMEGRDYIPEGFIATSFIGDVTNGQLRSAVAYGGYNGAMVEATIAVERIHKEMLWYMFHYPFVQLGVNKVVCRIDSSNEKSINLAKKLGFKYECILHDCSPDGDLHIVSLTKDECRYLRD